MTCHRFLPGLLCAVHLAAASEPGKAAKVSPLTPDEERASFTLPPGFEIELVAQESEGIGKFVTVAFDTRGRMWSMTALEYPVDANENPAAAKALFESAAKDKVVVFDKPFGSGPHRPRVFAEGLAMPLGLLPYKDGVYIQHGPKINFLSDTDHDGRADKTETILSGFGVQDSHLFPHQFTRAPGNWIWFAQGAFNYGKVKTSKGVEQQFDQTRMAKFRYDGSDLDITSQGPCNIWGLVLKGNGEAFIQEANEYGYPMMPFHEYANYPGCSDSQMKSYAPTFPGTAPDFQMGGTGLSGLALSDEKHWPAPYNNVFFVANPITRKIQAIRAHEDGPHYRLEKLPDFLLSTDEMFRPVGITVGPDGCLYIVDWYNKIISHNEVPRTHPDRDKKSGRIWRVKHTGTKPFAVPDFTKLSGKNLIAKLTSPSLAQTHLAWQAITDRQLTDTAPALKKLAGKGVIPALWALEGLKKMDATVLGKMISHTNRNVRREAIRAAGESLRPAEIFPLLEAASNDFDPEVRSQIIRTAGLFDDQRAVALVARFALPSLDAPTLRSTQSGKTIKTGEAYDREFQRYLVRLVLERHPDTLASFLAADAAENLPVENRLLCALALEPKKSATLVARLLPELLRIPSDEEILRLAQFPQEKGVEAALKRTLRHEEVLQALVRVRNRFDATALAPLLTGIAQSLWNKNNFPVAMQIVSAFRLAAFEDDLTKLLRQPNVSTTNQIAALRALREIGTTQDELFLLLAKSAGERTVRHESILALASSKSERAPEMIISLWPGLNAVQRRAALDSLTGTKTGAAGLLKSIRIGAFSPHDLDRAALDKMSAVLPDDADLKTLVQQRTERSQPVLRLDGKNNNYVNSDITLEGPFTVETWIKLAPGIDNNDGILGAEGQIDMNFHDAHFRVWTGNGGDVIVAKKKIAAEIWTHLAVTRDASGGFKIYCNGELDTADSKSAPQKFEHLKIGWSNPARGTDGWLTEFRVWNRARTAEEIRAEFDRSFDMQFLPKNLAHYFTNTNWPTLNGSARIDRSNDLPTLISPSEAKAQEEKFAKFRRLTSKPADSSRGKSVFVPFCQTCHSVAGQGGQVGPVLNGAGAMGLEGILRAILTPNAAMEAGYRTYRVELRDGDVLDGFLVSQNDKVIILRQPNGADQRISMEDVRRASFTGRSLMPEGLLESMSDSDAADLLSYLLTLK